MTEWLNISRQFQNTEGRRWADYEDEEDFDNRSGAGIIVADNRSWADVAAADDNRSWADVTAADDNRSWADVARRHVAAANVVAAADDRSWADVAAANVVAADVATNEIAADETAVDETAVNDSKPVVNEGDPVGIHAVQSILMSATQKSLSHFHTAGMNTTVCARLAPSPAEAMNADYSTNTSMTFKSSDSVYDLRRQLVGAKMSSFMITVGSSVTGLDDRENVWYEASGNKMYQGNLLRIYIDYNKMRDHGLTLENIAHAAFGDGTSCTSPDFMGIIDVNFGQYLSKWLAMTDNVVCGTLRIRSCNKAKDDVAITEGTDIIAVSRVLVNNKKTITSNDVFEVELHFGIEAAAGVLEELTGSYIVSDFMARTGDILPFVKSSVEVKHKGMLTSMGFEKPKDDIKRGCALYGSSVYESIMTGVDPPQMYSVRTGKP